MSLPERTDQECAIKDCRRTLKPRAVAAEKKYCWACWYKSKILDRTYRIKHSKEVRKKRDLKVSPQ